MLSVDDKRRVSKEGCAYEHAFEYLSTYLGEAFLLGNFLAFYDGHALNVCAFALGEPRKMSAAELNDGLRHLHCSIKPRVLHIWGNVEPEDSVIFNEMEFKAVERSTRPYEGEFTLDIGKAPLSSREVRKATNSFLRDELVCHSSRGRPLVWQEYDLIQAWSERVQPGLAGTIAGAAISTFSDNPSVNIIQCWQKETLLGFSTFFVLRDEVGVNLMSFSRRVEGVKVDDFLMHSTIEECKRMGIASLRLGYSGSASLSRFKQKWGAERTGPDYSQALYASDPADREQARDFSFFWWARLLAPYRMNSEAI